MKLTYNRPWITNYQRAIIDDPNRYTVTYACTKSGKTVSHYIWLHEQALQGKAGQEFWWVAPIYEQTKIAFKRLKLQVNQPQLYHFNLSELSITLWNKAVIRFKSADKPDGLYGEDVYAAVFDEFTRAKEDAWFALRSTLTKTKGKCKFIGNAIGSVGWAHNMYIKAKQDGYAHLITYKEAVKEGILEDEEIEQARRDMPSDMFKALYECVPMASEANPFGHDNIERCLRPIGKGPAKFYGLDIGFRHDYTVLIGLNERGEVCDFHRFTNKAWEDQKQALVPIIGDAQCYFDATGVGEGPAQDLTAWKPNFVPVVYTGGQKPGANNTVPKTDLMRGLQIAIEKQEITFPKGPIEDELKSFEYKLTTGGKITWNAPSGMHDDCVNALALVVRARNLGAFTRKVVFVG